MMNYDQLIATYETDVRFPEVSGMEHLDMLMTRSEIASIELYLSDMQRKRVLQADRQLMSQARQFYDAIQAIADLASWRRSEFTPITHWWWYLDVLAHLPVSLDTATLLDISADEIDEVEWLYAAAHNPAFDFLYDPEEDVHTLADGKINTSLSQNSI